MQLHLGRLGPQPRHQVRQQHLAGVGGGREVEHALGLGGVELGRRHRVLEHQEAPPQLGPDLGRAGGRLHAVGPTQEQFVLQSVSQPVQGVADGGLGQGEAFARARDAALLGQGVEYPEEVEIERLEMNFTHSSRDNFSFESYNSSF